MKKHLYKHQMFYDFRNNALLAKTLVIKHTLSPQRFDCQTIYKALELISKGF